MNGKHVRNLLAVSVACVALGSAAYVSAAPAANWSAASGAVWMTGYGDCWRTAQWRAENVQFPQCSGYIEPVVEVAPAPQPPAPPPAPQFTTTTLNVETLFDFDSAVLRPAGREALGALAATLTNPENSYAAVLIEGHTCSIGPAIYNQGLSERRAQAAATYLIGQGVRADAVRVLGYGEERPIADNATRAGREANRRVEITTDVRQRVR